ncbi:hypothetical protein XENIA_39 [Paenibacillus phage Xenia]|uniref:Uncharacterized protein n=1 Tax=Paenibacillus phage Xenia TaxID=1636263 RepID=A0A0K2CYS3_9CAUD|nr:hypothetical protein XENIA_39 [Paenibacillus phage Xenia]ALA12562.1 hypothetical protein XENIA_39 [Paenibacillus phage Xenia]
MTSFRNICFCKGLSKTPPNLKLHKPYFNFTKKWMGYTKLDRKIKASRITYYYRERIYYAKTKTYIHR